MHTPLITPPPHVHTHTNTISADSLWMKKELLAHTPMHTPLYTHPNQGCTTPYLGIL